MLYRAKIHGQPHATRETAVIYSPYDGAAVGEVSVGSAHDIEAALRSMAQGFAAMQRLATHERVRLLEGIVAGLRQQSDALAQLITRESGKPIRHARAEVLRAITTFSLAAAEARSFGGELLPVDLQPGLEGRLCVFRRVARGPIAAISPFNFPLNLVAHKLAPALAIGSSVLLKPAQQAPLTAHLLSDIVDGAGAPPGAFNVVHCPAELGETLVRDERPKVLSFTGSDVLGWKLKQLAGKKHVLLELGGNAPCIVDEGVDLDAVMPRIVDAAWSNAGQTCIKAQRVFVHANVFDAFVESFVAQTEALVVGDPLAEATVIGPLIEQKHVQRVLEWIDEAERGGARVLIRGRIDGQLLGPTIVTGTQPGMRVRDQEVFGPVTVLEPAASFEAALELANAGRFGLQASVFTPRLDHALRAYEVLSFGAVLVNDAPNLRVDNYPYGGVKDSGVGREGVRFAMEELSEPKVLLLRGG